MLYCTGLLAFTGTGEKSSPRQITLYNSVTRTVLKNLQLPTTVLNLQLSRQYMAVVLELKTLIYTIGEKVVLWCTIPTSSNPRGVAALSLTTSSPSPSRSPSSSKDNKVLLAVPGDHSKGVIHVHDISKRGEGSVLEIEAHQTPLGLLVWNSDGSMLASASVKGTVIRIFNPVQGTKLFTLRRGTKPARITSMSFSPQTSCPFFCVASERGNVHIFRLTDTSAKLPARFVVRKMFSAMKHKTLTCSGDRIAKIELPCKPGTAAVCNFRSCSSSAKSIVAAVGGGKENEEEEEELKIQVATGEGILYHYSIKEEKGKATAQTSLEGQWVFA
jgi:WD40 repeat protein